jgi:hypothetical protein
MSVSSELEKLDAERSTSPATLYKYVVAERIDVLENASIRFTPPVNTNDIFEVRQTFDLMAGPKMVSFFQEIAPQVDFEETLRGALDEMGLNALSGESAKALVRASGGGDLETMTRSLLGQVIGDMPTLMNEPANIDRLLDKMASGQLLLSLTERMDSSPMWAHYAAKSAGFVMAFDTRSVFFRRGEKSELNGLHKVRYFDDRVGELLDDPFAALISKQADWAYEREWRLYVKPENMTRVVRVNDDDIHLVEFPRDALQRVVLGTRASPELQAQIQAILSRSYPGTRLTRLVADRNSASLNEVPLT